jgi:toxin-antitoxin system PIN domain toxin
MILPDVNVLLSAYNADSPDFSKCRAWLDAIVTGPAAYGMSPQVLSSVVRIATNRRVFPMGHPTEKVLEFCNGLLSAPNCHVILPGPRHWQIFCALCVQADAKGDLVSDAWFAALAIEHGCEWVTLDRDFARFPKLRWRTPF